MSTCKRCKSWESGIEVCWNLASIAREAIKANGVSAAENIRIHTKPDSSCSLIDELAPGEVPQHTEPEVTDLDVLRARASAWQTTAHHWRKQCERAEARVRELEQELCEAGRLAEAFGMPLPRPGQETRRQAE